MKPHHLILTLSCLCALLTSGCAVEIDPLPGVSLQVPASDHDSGETDQNHNDHEHHEDD